VRSSQPNSAVVRLELLPSAPCPRSVPLCHADKDLHMPCCVVTIYIAAIYYTIPLLSCQISSLVSGMIVDG
jgi:hypothetical protein